MPAPPQCVARLNEFVARLKHLQPTQHNPDLDQALYEARSGCQEAMDHDLNVPQALGRLFAFIRHANRFINNGELDAAQVEKILDFVRQVNCILDVIELEDTPGDEHLQRLIDERQQARAARDFSRADALRQELQSQGVQIIDTPAGPRWKKTR